MANNQQTAQKIVYASVLLDKGIGRPLTYSIPENLVDQISIGQRVSVPLRSRIESGTVLSLSTVPDFAKTLPIIDILPSHFPPNLLELAKWMATYYCAPLPKILKFILPPSVHNTGKHKKQLWVRSLLSKNELKQKCIDLRSSNTAQAEVLDIVLRHSKGLFLTRLLEKSKSSRSPIDTLVKQNILTIEDARVDRLALNDLEFFPTQPKKLNEEQQTALDQIIAHINRGVFAPHLIFGVTGSGKTEVYLQAIQHTLSLGKTVIFLVPEIALTSQTVERLRSRFEKQVALIHHRLSAGEKFDTWHAIEQGKVQIVIGARSAIFAPLSNIGLIIVDEEHEPSYKQSDEAPCYNGRDVAIMRAKLTSATILLGSATPSLESYTNALNEKYYLNILSTRAEKAQLPTVTLIDMKREYEKQGYTLFSQPLLDALKNRFERGEQSILFLNRRGYHSMRICAGCGEALSCPHCDARLTFHRSDNYLSCHLCDYMYSPPPRACPECKCTDTLRYKGAGTEQVEASLNRLFPEMRVLRLDADTTRKKGSHEMIFKQFRSGKADVLIGTQMVAKGLHFPSVTLVAVLNADTQLSLPDFRASERAFQLITQVAGRSGRGQLPGQVLIQTLNPTNSAITCGAAQDYIAFYKEEITAREAFSYPPFSRLVKISFSGKNQDATLACAENYRKKLLTILPPIYELYPVTPSGYAKIKDQFRFQFLIRGKTLGPFCNLACDMPTHFKHVRLSIDVDPSSSL